MAGILGGIAVASAQLHHIFLRTEHARDNHLVQRNALDIKAVEEGLTDILQEHGGARHQVWYAGIQRIDVIIRIGTDIHQFAFARFGILAVTYRRDAPLLCCGELDGISIGKSFRITGYGTDAMVFLGGRRNVEGGRRIVCYGNIFLLVRCAP